MLTPQRIDLYQPLVNTRVGPPPLTLRVGTTPNVDNLVGGVPHNIMKIETYVLLSALPSDMQERVKLAIQTLLAGR
jgi:hypothetical protein